MATKLILIRHGQTRWNYQKRYSGFIDVALNREGKKQALKLHRKLQDEKIHKVYSSNKIRAIQTATIVFKRQEIEIIPDLREMYFGAFEGLTYKEVMARYPVVYQKWLRDPSRIRIPQGESPSSFKKRVASAFRKIISRNRHKTIAVICHGGTISVFMNSVLKSKKFWENIPQSASLSIVEFKKRKANVRLLNDVSHL